MDIINHPQLQKFARTCPAGFVIMTEGDQADSLYILIEGSLDVIKGGKKIHEITEPGSFFGELSFLLGTVRIASVITATEETRFLCLPNSEVNLIWRQFPEFARQLARNLANRLYETTNVAQGFREFCDQMPDAVIMTNAKLTVLSWNRAAEKLYGRSWPQMSGKSIADIYDQQASFKQFLHELHAKGAVREKILKVNHPDKEWFFVSTSTTILKDPHENTQGYLFLSRDATSLQKLEKKERHLRKWLLPIVLGLTMLTGWLGWRQLTPGTQPAPQAADQRGYERIIGRLNRDSATLELALRPALAADAPQTARRVLADYFSDFQPELAGITGALILVGPVKILAAYRPEQPDNQGLTEQPYRGTELAEITPYNHKTMSLSLIFNPAATGNQEVDVLVALKKSPVWLAFHLDLDFIKREFDGDIKGLIEAVNRQNQPGDARQPLPSAK
jgi:PAS domain S-box-containing protein